MALMSAPRCAVVNLTKRAVLTPRPRLQKIVAGDTLLCWACRWGTQQLEARLGGSRPLQKDLAVAVANAHCDAAEKVGRHPPAARVCLLQSLKRSSPSPSV
jgi:hypothetical protein